MKSSDVVGLDTLRCAACGKPVGRVIALDAKDRGLFERAWCSPECYVAGQKHATNSGSEPA